MADHGVAVELYYSGGWNAHGTYTRDGITLSRGAPGEGQDAPPSTAGLTLENFAGELSPDNASSPLYGLVGRNTPVRVVADGSTRSTTELGKLALDRTLDADGVAMGDAWATVQGGGILRRLQQGTTPLRSPLHRAMLTAAPVAFWPLNEPDTAVLFSSALPAQSGFPLAGSGMLPGKIKGPAGTSGLFPSITHKSGSMFAETTFDPTGLTSAGWGFECVIYCGPATDPLVGELLDPTTALAAFPVTGTSDAWFVGSSFDDTDGPGITVVGSIGEANMTVGVFEGLELGWHHVRLTVEDSGADVLLTLWIDGVNTANAGANFDLRTVAGATVPTPTGRIQLGQSTAPTAFDENAEPCSIGMLAFFALAGATDRSAASLGYPGELAGVRFLRVLGEEGVAAAVVGDEEDTQPMGPQPSDTLVNIARECVRTDDGLMFEPVDDRALVMRTGRSRYNQTAAAVFDFAAGVFAPGLVPIYDDQNTRNYVVVENRSGGTSAPAVKATGPLNMSDPLDDPEGVGKFDTRVAVNTETDDVLYSRATWEVSKGTVAEPRYGVITIDLDASPSLIATVDALDIGDRFEIENLPADWSLAPASLLLLGVKEKYPPNGGDFRRLVTLNAAPASPYEVLLVGAADGSVDLRGMRAGTERSTVDGAHTNSDTTILIDSDGIGWTTDADNWDVTKNGGGMFLTIAGELVRVTGIAGAGSAWALSVVRSVNGVVKAIADGTPVRFAYPGRLGL